MTPSDIWIAFGLLVVAVFTALGALIRYFVGLLREVDKQLDDKISVGEYNRRHQDLERELRVHYEQRLRLVERWQDQLNGRLRARNREERENRENNSN